jgi:hypothetical protein
MSKPSEFSVILLELGRKCRVIITGRFILFIQRALSLSTCGKQAIQTREENWKLLTMAIKTPFNSAVEYWDFPVITKPLAVHYIMELIRDYKRDLYEYRPSGMGCQF